MTELIENIEEKINRGRIISASLFFAIIYFLFHLTLYSK